VTPDMVEKYEKKRGHGVPQHIVPVDAALVYQAVRQTVGHAVMFGAPKATGFQGRNRPRVHHIRLGILQVHSVALAVVELMRKHGGPALKAVSSTNKSGLQVVQLIIKEMDRIAAFCAFGQFLDSKKAVGNIRLTGSAKWSGDMIAVGPPLMLTVTESRTPGLCSSELAFATVHINGKTGKPTYPHMASGMLKRPATREKLVTHVRDALPAEHPLRVNGWCRLPAQVTSLAAKYAIPSAPKKAKAKAKAKA